MNGRTRVFIAAAALFLFLPVRAESLRCSGGSVAEGDSRISVGFKCGPPLLKDSYCAPVYVANSPYPVPEPVASYYVPCLASEDWLYDRGTGNLMATVRFRFGTVQSIIYGQVPR
jgi:Protein of unknown function (DUF2845)